MIAGIGETIREIRKGKGILQKQLYKDIVSITFAIQFEKGIHSISAESFLQILDRLEMSSEEFNNLRLNFSPDSLKEISYQIVDAINSENINELEILSEELKNFNNHPHYLLIRAFSILNITRLKNEDITQQTEEIDYLILFLSRIETWTLSDIARFTNLLPFLPYSMLKVHLSKIEKKLLSLKQLNLLCYFYLNFIDCALSAEDFQTAKKLAIRLGKVAIDPEFLFFKILSGIYLELIDTSLNFNEDSLKKIQDQGLWLDSLTSFKVSKQLDFHINKIKDKNIKSSIL